MSETNLLSALLAFQADAPSLQKDKINPAFKSKYLSLNALMEQILPTLNRHGLVWATFPTHLDGYPALNYRLIHAESGDVMEGTMLLLLSKQDPQGLGSALTYARRQSVMAVLGLVADEDDDGNKGSGQGRRGNGVQKPQEAAQPPSRPRVDSDSLDALRRRFKDTGWTPETLAMQLTAVGAGDVSDVRAAMQALSPEQARQLLSSMNSAVDEQIAAQEALRELEGAA